MENTSKTIAGLLLQINAIKLEPANPFKWASGWRSPIYCDNRQTLSYPEVRQTIAEAFAETIQEQYPDTDAIAGVATGAIAHGVLVADLLGLPFVYVRSAPKEHGLANLVEGYLKPGSKVVVIEDLISTGKSSLKAVEALRDFNCTVLGMLAIFTYGFDNATENFKMQECKLHTLTDYQTVIEMAAESNYIKKTDIDILKKWREMPDKWDAPIL